MIYKLLKLIIGLGIRLYYREIRVKNKERLNQIGGKIIIANHPNTMMDGWIISYITKEPIYFMAKGTFFNSPFKKWLLKGLGLIPINRASESATKGVKNTDSFEACYRLLEEGKTVVIFPEGTSYKEMQLRELKSGTARIALEVAKREKIKSPILVLPIGLVYTEAEAFRSSVLVSVGEAISPEPYLDLFKQNSSKAARGLTDVFTKKLSSLLVNAKSNSYDGLVDRIIALYGKSKMRFNGKNMEKDIDFIKSINSRINDISEKNPRELEFIQLELNEIQMELDKLHISPAFLDRNYRSVMFIRQIIQSILALVLGLPFFIYGIVHNGIPYKFVDFIIPKLIKDIEYYAPVAVLMGLVLYPLNYFGFVFLVDYFFDLTFWEKVLYFFSMPIFGLIAYRFFLYTSYISVKTDFVIEMKTQKDKIAQLRKRKTDLFELLFTSNTPS
jgi:1-acyl-sn-glycerol-3-phosphate acyltransferase